MDEFNEFIKIHTDDSTSINSIKAYKNRYTKILKLAKVENLKDIEDYDLINALETEPNGNTRKTLLNLAIMLREKLHNYDVTDIRSSREECEKIIKIQQEAKNKTLKYILPEYETLMEHTEELFNRKRYDDYILMYLLTNFNVRNEDLNFEIVQKKREMIDDNKNYLWLNKYKVEYYRNNYKTKKFYGNKIHIINDGNFLKAVRSIKTNRIIPDNNIAYYVIKASGGLGESKIFKIMVNHFRKQGNLQKISSMSFNRGTAMGTTVEEYDIEKTGDDDDDSYSI